MAKKLFAKRGYFGVSIADLAAELSISKASVFHYISTKEELAVCVIEDIHEKFRDSVFNEMIFEKLSQQQKESLFLKKTEEFFKQEHQAVFLGLLYLECNTEKTQKIKQALETHFNGWRSILRKIFMPEYQSGSCFLQVQNQLNQHHLWSHVGMAYFF